MFDDQTKKNSDPVEDIFSGTDTDVSVQSEAPNVPGNLPIAPGKSALAVEENKKEPDEKSSQPDPASQPTPAPIAPTTPPAPPVAPNPSAMPSVPTPPKSSSGIGKVLFIVFIALFIILVAGFLAYKIMIQTDSVEGDGALDVPEPTPIEENQNIADEDEELDGEKLDSEEIRLLKERDSDGDGLSDWLEMQYGTDPYRADTDNDGLGDREEVEVYGTDPLNPDTDGDGYLDGEEVNAGFNPNGPGRLYEIPKIEEDK